MPLITLLTDFGQRDSYVAEMKAALLRICGLAQPILDVSHDISPYAIIDGAYLLQQMVAIAPAETIHIGVVDPGVGSSRLRLILEMELPQGRAFFVGPDNGLASLLLESYAATAWSIKEIDPSMRFAQSTTFDGRDVFVPAAAMLALGKQVADFSEPVALTELATEPFHQTYECDRSEGVILHIDRFGNAACSLRVAAAESLKSATVVIGERSQHLRVISHFEQLAADECGLLPNSHGYYEIVARQASAAELLDLRQLQRVKFIY